MLFFRHRNQIINSGQSSLPHFYSIKHIQYFSGFFTNLYWLSPFMQYQSPHWSQVESHGGTTSTVLLRQHFFTLCAEIYTGSLRESIRSLVTYFKHHQSMESPMYQQSINSEIASYDELNPRSWELKSPCELLTTRRNCVTTVRSSHRPEPQNLLVQLMLWTLNKYWMNKWQETLRILKFIIRRCKYATQTSWRLDPDPDKMRSFF